MVERFSTGITTSTFNYQNIGSYSIVSDIPNKMGKMKENSLKFLTEFESGAFYKPQVKLMAEELENVARHLAIEYGLGNSRLIKYIKAEPKESAFIEFTNEAVDDYGRYYAGFVEYGHRTKNGVVPPRPFMRNALTIVSAASVGMLEQAMENLWWGQSESANIHQLQFGRFLDRRSPVLKNMQNAPISSIDNTEFLSYKERGGMRNSEIMKTFNSRATNQRTFMGAGKNFTSLNSKAKRRGPLKTRKEKEGKKDKKKDSKKSTKKKSNKKTSPKKQPKRQKKEIPLMSSSSAKRWLAHGKAKKQKNSRKTKSRKRKKTKGPVKDIKTTQNYQRTSFPDGSYKDKYGKKYFVVNGRIIKSK